MVRALLALWYATTVLVGPALCCCAARPAPAEARTTADTPAVAPKGCCCCAPEADGPAARSPAAAPNDGPGKCPCKKFDRPDQDRPGPAAGESFAQPRSLDLPPADPVAHGHLPVLSAAGLVGGHSPGNLSGRSGRDLLTAYHILRC